jgi:hypothetical protein
MRFSEMSTHSRRDFLAHAARAAGAAFALHSLPSLAQEKTAQAAELGKPAETPRFPREDAVAWKRTWDATIAVLAGNIRSVPGYSRPVLFEGSTYQGIWLECGPHEGLVYATLAKYIPEGLSKTTPIEAAQQSHGVLCVAARGWATAR